jgi:uncharacterized protein (UPF0261 family)
LATIVLVGTLDAKVSEYEFLRRRLRGNGVDVLLVDPGVPGELNTAWTLRIER